MPCASCFRRLKAGHHETASRPELKKEIDRVLDRPYRGTVTIRHPLEVLSVRESRSRG